MKHAQPVSQHDKDLQAQAAKLARMCLSDSKLYAIDEICRLPKKKAMYLTGLVLEELRKEPKGGAVAARIFLSAMQWAALEGPRSRTVRNK